MRNETYQYDALDRLTQANGIYGSIDYAYDEVGNRLTKQKVVGATTTTDTNTFDVTSNRLLSSLQDINGVQTTRTLGYSATGSLDADTRHDATVRTLSHSDRNRLSDVSDGSGTLGSYTYNALGQRAEKVSGSITHFVYGLDGELIAEADSLGNRIRDYVYVNGVLTAIATPSDLLSVFTNHLGTPFEILDNNGSIAWKGDYTPFGELTEVVTTVTHPIRLPGQYADGETDQHYNYFRDYDPTLGRYVQSDPIGFASGQNTYLYAEGNPEKFIDPRGLTTLVAPRPFIGPLVRPVNPLTRPVPMALEPEGERGGDRNCPSNCKLAEDIPLGEIEFPFGLPRIVTKRICVYICDDGFVFSRVISNVIGCSPRVVFGEGDIPSA